MTIRYSRGRAFNDAHPENRAASSFDAFRAAVLSDTSPRKGLAYIAAPFRPNGDGRPHRCKDGALERSWLAFDFDHVEDGEFFAEIRLWLSKWQGFGYFTASSTPAAPRARVILAADRDMTREEAQRVCLAIDRELSAVFGPLFKLDPSVYRAEQPVFTPTVGAQSFELTGDPVDVDHVLAGAPPLQHESTALERATEAEAADPVVAELQRRKMLIRHVTAGKLAVVCPFDSEHSSSTSDTATVYLLPNFGGVRFGKFHCLHEHCSERRQEAFLEALELKPAEVWRVQSGRLVARSDAPEGSTDARRDEGGTAEAVAPEFSDDQLALEFVAQYGQGFRWTPGMDWMRDTGTHWVRDDHLLRFNASRTICRASAAIAPDKVQIRLASAKTVAAVVSLAQSDPRLVVPAAEWDRDPMILNTPGGIVDLRTGALRPRTRGDHLTQVTAVAPDGAMRCPNWLRFIAEVFVNDASMIEFIQRLGGYILTGDRREQKLFFAHGIGANGKSTLLDLWLEIMGSYALKLPTSALMQSPVERHPTELAQLRGKRLAMSNELEEGGFWAESRIKELTGDESLTARFMRQDFFEFRQSQKHLIAGNHKPRLRGGDPAIARRMVLIPFSEVFEGRRKDKGLPHKLRAESPAVLAWMIAGAVKWHADGLAIPPRVRGASHEYLAEHDDLALWVDECCAPEPDVTETAGDLYASFRLWKQARGEHAPSMTVWGQRLALVPGVSKRKSSGIKYTGIRLTLAARQALQSGAKP